MTRRITRRQFIWAAATGGVVALARLHFALRGAVAARWAYHLGLQGRLRISRHEITLARVPVLPRPLTIAFASDLHAGPTTHPLVFERLMEELVRAQPDVLLLGGDYVVARPRHVDGLVNVLARYSPPLGTYAVLGNHDLAADASRRYIPRRLESVGAHVLVNRNVPLPGPFGNVSICGIDDPWLGRADVAAAFESAGPGRIFLTHSPRGLASVGDTRFDVALAGHTHGGQIAYPDGTPVVAMGGPLSRRYNRGRFEIPGKGSLIVSRGVGCSVLPIRFNSDPELILLTVRGAGQAA
jgi:uncharacterized protein